MSLAISVATSEGIIVAGESRQTYVGRAGARIGSENAVKVFELTDRIVAATTGWAFLRPQGVTNPRSIASLVQEFKISALNESRIEEVATILGRYFQQIYEWHVAQGVDPAVAPGQVALTFIVAGYNPDSNIGLVYQCVVPEGRVTPLRDTNNPGASWNGQSEIMTRLIKGWDPRLLNLAFVQQADPSVINQLNGLECVINWSFMTLQDAIDFAASMIEITTSIQRFADGIQMNPGDVQGVGGPIDIAVLTPGAPVRWIRRKDLHS